jgi:hypothetical protein
VLLSVCVLDRPRLCPIADLGACLSPPARVEETEGCDVQDVGQCLVIVMFLVTVEHPRVHSRQADPFLRMAAHYSGDQALHQTGCE